MPKVTAWQCPKSGRLFATEEEYRIYLKRAAKKLWSQRMHENAVNTLEDTCRTELWPCGMLEDISSWVMANQKLLCWANRPDWPVRHRARGELLSFELTSPQFRTSWYTYSQNYGKGILATCKFSLQGYEGDRAENFFESTGMMFSTSPFIAVGQNVSRFEGSVFFPELFFENLALMCKLAEPIR